MDHRNNLNPLASGLNNGARSPARRQSGVSVRAIAALLAAHALLLVGCAPSSRALRSGRRPW